MWSDVVGSIDPLNSDVAVFDNVRVFVATAASEKVCAAIGLLSWSEFIEFFGSNFTLQNFFDQFGLFFRRPV